MVKSEVTVKVESGPNGCSTKYEVKEVSSLNGWAKEGHFPATPAEASPNGSSTRTSNGSNEVKHERIKREASPSADEPTVHGSSTVEDVKPLVKLEQNDSGESERPADVQAYLNFEMDDDKKVKSETYADSPYSRSTSPEASTSALKDESEEPARKPGMPMSIADLPNAEEEVSFAGPGGTPLKKCLLTYLLPTGLVHI